MGCMAFQTTCGVAGMGTSRHAERIGDRVDDRRRRGDGAGLAAALDAERVGRAGRAGDAELERRQVVPRAAC